MELIGVILGAETSDIRFGEMKAMLDYGFAVYDSVALGEKNVSLGTVAIEKGSGDSVEGVLAEDVDILTKKEEKQQITKEIYLEESLPAPIKKGDKVGVMKVLKNGEVTDTYDIVAQNDVDRWKIFDVVKGMVEYSFKK